MRICKGRIHKKSFCCYFMQFAYHMVLAAVILFCCNVYDDGSQKLLSIHFLLLFGDLFLINVSYSSCACLMPVSPVTVFTVTKGSFNL